MYQDSFRRDRKGLYDFHVRVGEFEPRVAARSHGHAVHIVLQRMIGELQWLPRQPRTHEGGWQGVRVICRTCQPPFIFTKSKLSTGLCAERKLAARRAQKVQTPFQVSLLKRKLMPAPEPKPARRNRARGPHYWKQVAGSRHAIQLFLAISDKLNKIEKMTERVEFSKPREQKWWGDTRWAQEDCYATAT